MSKGKTITTSYEAWKALSILKALLNHRSLDQTIRFLIKYCHEQRCYGDDYEEEK